VDGCEGRFVIDSGECLADVKRFAVAVEIAVIVGRELRLTIQFAGEQAAGQRDARENSDAPPPGFLEKQFGGALAEAVEDDLDGLNAWILDSFERFLDALHTDSVVPDLAFLDEAVEHAENVR